MSEQQQEPEQPAGQQPHFGHTRHGLPVHARVIDHHRAGSAYQRLNKRVALWLVTHVGSMTCFWVFWVMGFTILPSVLHSMGVLGSRWIGPAFMLGFGFNLLGTWLISTCFQAVLLPGIMVGQALQNEASDARSAKQFEDTEAVRTDLTVALDRLDEKTEGGLKAVLDAVNTLASQVAPPKRLATQAERSEGTGP